MTSRLILTIASALCTVSGLGALFAPDELATLASSPAQPVTALALQVAGGGLLSIALLDLFNRNTRVGGIYGRPIGLANLMISGVIGVVVGRAALNGALPLQALLVAAPFAAVALSFASLVFGSTGKPT